MRSDVLDTVAQKLAPGGGFLMATDDERYAAEACRVFDAHPAFAGGRAARPPWRPIAGYEARAVAENRSVVDLWYRRI